MHAEDPQLDRGRLARFLASVLFVGSVVLIVLEASGRRLGSAALPLMILGAYLVASGTLLTVIAGRLYQRHGMRRAAFDLGSLVILMVLLSLPFCVANALWNITDLGNLVGLREYKSGVILFLSVALLVLMLPVFHMTEAIMVWGSRLRNRRRQR